MAKELELSKSFTDKIRDRIRAAIGELLTDEDIAKLVERGIEEALFENRRIPTGDYRNYETLPPLMHVWADKYMKDAMHKAVQDWLRNNPDRVHAIIEKTLQEGAGQALMAAFTGMVRPSFQSFSADLRLKFQQIGIELPDHPY